VEYKWRLLAACRGADTGLFFPVRGASNRKAKAMCRKCRVRAECLDYAVETNQPAGVWGGKTERARREIRLRFSA